jgi:peroxiredoxin
MLAETMELGPVLDTIAPDFALQNHDRVVQNLSDIMGEKGLLIGFINDIWKPASIRRILFMQRHYHKFVNHECNLVLLIADDQYTLYTFYMSSPMTVVVPMLADPDHSTHQQYNMHHAGLVLMDSDQILRAKWLMPDERVWPKVSELMAEVYALDG